MKKRKRVLSKERLVEQCRGCLLADFENNVCTAFYEPTYQFRLRMQCWGRCEDVSEIIKRLESIVGYVKSKPVWQAAKKELDEWRTVAKMAIGR